MKPQPRVFDRDQPCTKLEIWNCFRAPRGFKRVQVDKAKAEIGANAPRAMLRNNYLETYTENGVEYYQLTEIGIEWLRLKFINYLRNHPENRRLAKFPPRMT